MLTTCFLRRNLASSALAELELPAMMVMWRGSGSAFQSSPALLDELQAPASHALARMTNTFCLKQAHPPSDL